MKKRALFPGSFDPPSLGHLDIIRRASKICDELYIGVAINAHKQELFSIQERVELLKKSTALIPHVEVVSFNNLVVDFAKQQSIDFLIRGLRAFSDFEYEFRMALANRKLGGIETVFLMADAQLAHISATLIREVAAFGRQLTDFLPAEIEDQVVDRLHSKKLV